MPMQKGKSMLGQLLGDEGRKAHLKHRADETEVDDFGDLPAGIVGGVAQLVDCRFDRVKEGKQNAGKPYFYCAGIVKSPTEFEGMKVEGLRTSIIEPLYATPTRSRKTVGDHLAWVENRLRLFGVETSQLGDLGDLEPAAEAISRQKPHFSFRTWKGEKQTEGEYAGREPRVQHSWGGLAQWNGEADGNDAMQDETGGGDEDQEKSPSLDQVGAGVLAAAADGGDEEAIERLKAMALEQGITEEKIDNADSWAIVAELVEAESDGEVDWKPEEGGVCYFWPLNPKTKKPSKKVECQVVSVDAKKQMANVKSLVTKTVYKDVAWGSLTDIN